MVCIFITCRKTVSLLLEIFINTACSEWYKKPLIDICLYVFNIIFKYKINQAEDIGLWYTFFVILVNFIDQKSKIFTSFCRKVAFFFVKVFTAHEHRLLRKGLISRYYSCTERHFALLFWSLSYSKFYRMACYAMYSYVWYIGIAHWRKW